MLIYVITNKINGKQYVGQTVQQMEARWSAHKSISSLCVGLKSAFHKYGVENFTIEKLCYVNSLEELNKMERKYIKELRTMSPNGYNLTTGGEQPKFSEESRIKMSASHRGKKQPEHIRKMKSEAWKGSGNPNFGGNFSEEHKKKIAAASTGNSSRAKVPVVCNESGTVYPSMSHAAKDLGINVGHLYQVINGKRKSARGFTFSKVL
jgi:group I intron endonuclease